MACGGRDVECYPEDEPCFSPEEDQAIVAHLRSLPDVRTCYKHSNWLSMKNSPILGKFSTFDLYVRLVEHILFNAELYSQDPIEIAEWKEALYSSGYVKRPALSIPPPPVKEIDDTQEDSGSDETDGLNIVPWSERAKRLMLKLVYKHYLVYGKKISWVEVKKLGNEGFWGKKHHGVKSQYYDMMTTDWRSYVDDPDMIQAFEKESIRISKCGDKNVQEPL